MALNIANRRVEAKALEVAKLTGKNKTASVEAALDYYIRAHKEHAARLQQAKRTKMREVLKRLSARPVVDARPAGDIVDYDGDGLPT